MRLFLAISFAISSICLANPFENGKLKFEDLKGKLIDAIAPIQEQGNTKIQNIKKLIAIKTTEKQNCTTFECSQLVSTEIEELNSNLGKVENDLKFQLAQAEKPYGVCPRTHDLIFEFKLG